MRALKRIGCFACLVLSIAWAASCLWHIQYGIRRSTPGGFAWMAVHLGEGGIELESWADPRALSGVGVIDGWWYGAAHRPPYWGFRFHSADLKSSFLTGWSLFVPFWVPLLVCGIPTAVLWRRTRGATGCCPCGYPRAGLREGAPCPECGRAPRLSAAVGSG